MSSVPEMISVPRKVRSLMAGETMPSEPSEMTTAAEMATATEMAAAAEMTTAASTPSTMCERSGRRQRQNAGHNQTDK